MTVALPRLVGGEVIDTSPLPLIAAEQAEPRASAGVLRAALDDLDANS